MGTDMFEDVLCYSKAKRPLLMTSVTSRTPVKINRFTKTEDGTKLIINNMTSVTVADQAEYFFQYTEPVEVITDVSTVIEEKDPYNMVNIRGKVVQLTPVEKVGKQQFKLRNGAFVDSTGVIKLQIWQENIAEIEEGKAYTVTLARVGIWKGEKSVGTTKLSVITTYTGDLDTKDVSSEEIQDQTTKLLSRFLIFVRSNLCLRIKSVITKSAQSESYKSQVIRSFTAISAGIQRVHRI
jgi:hypothetical protein